MSKITILIPIYNGEKTIDRCLESVVNQTFSEWRCLLLDDASTDGTKEKCLSWVDKDNRFEYVSSEPYQKGRIPDKDYLGISNQLNKGLEMSKTKYVARLDIDDMMKPNRLEFQYEYMESHPDVGVMGTAIEIFDSNNDEFNGQLVEIEFDELTPSLLLQDVKVPHPTVMMNREILLEKLPYFYEHCYDYVEDTKLWWECLIHGVKISCVNNALTLYSWNQNKNSDYLEQQMTLNKLLKIVYTTKNSDENKLTAIVTFKNEGYEVEKTVCSIRFTDKNVNILLIDDGSTDNFPYERIAKCYGCDYVKNPKSYGCAGSRNVGVEHCKTPYFIIFDAHMRMTSFNWSKFLVEYLEKNDNHVLCGNTIIMNRDDHEDLRFAHYTNEDCIDGRNNFLAHGAKFCHRHDGGDWNSEWCYDVIDDDIYHYTSNYEDEHLLIPIVVLLGACYAMSVKWYNHIHGLNGLVQWGCDEPLLSLKTHLMGGEIYLTRNWFVGHLYRSRPIYGDNSALINDMNLKFVQMLTIPPSPNFEEEFNKYWEWTYENCDDKYFEELEQSFNMNKELYLKEHNYIYSHAVRGIDYVLDLESRLKKSTK